jgi:hypothetical protein
MEDVQGHSLLLVAFPLALETKVESQLSHKTCFPSVGPCPSLRYQTRYPDGFSVYLSLLESFPSTSRMLCWEFIAISLPLPTD